MVLSMVSIAAAAEETGHCSVTEWTTLSLVHLQSDAWKQAFQLPEIILKRDIELGDLVLGFEQSRCGVQPVM
jgi:hypothetical protein